MNSKFHHQSCWLNVKETRLHYKYKYVHQTAFSFAFFWRNLKKVKIHLVTVSHHRRQRVSVPVTLLFLHYLRCKQKLRFVKKQRIQLLFISSTKEIKSDHCGVLRKHQVTCFFKNTYVKHILLCGQ